MKKQKGITVVEVAMSLVLVAIMAVVAIPQFSQHHDEHSKKHNSESSAKVKSAFAMAIAEKGDFPTLSEMVEYIDVDFASEKNDLSGIIFRDNKLRLTVNTYRDSECKYLTNHDLPGSTDIVRCIQSFN